MVAIKKPVMEPSPDYLFGPTGAEKPRFTAGDQVRVHAGPFAGVEGTVLGYCTASRLVIAVDLNCQGVTLEIDEGRLGLRPPRDQVGWGDRQGASTPFWVT